MPRRTQLGYGFSNHLGRQARDPPVADDRCTRRVLHHTTMINDQQRDTITANHARARWSSESGILFRYPAKHLRISSAVFVQT
jgi:hypothetical protein